MERYEFEDLISDYLENSLSLKKRKGFELYLSENPGSAELVGQMKNTIMQMKSVERVTTSVDFMDRLMNKIQVSKNNTRQYTGEQSAIFGFTPLYASVMTSLVLALVFVGFQLFSTDLPLSTSELSTVAQEKPPAFLDQIIPAQEPDSGLTAVENDSLNRDNMDKTNKDYSGKIRFVKD